MTVKEQPRKQLRTSPLGHIAEYISDMKVKNPKYTRNTDNTGTKKTNKLKQGPWQQKISHW